MNMQKLSIDELNLFATTQGVMSIPSESGMTTTKNTVRDYLLFNHRINHPQLLENNQQFTNIKISQNKTGEQSNFFVFKLLVKPLLNNFSFSNDDLNTALFNTLLQTLSTSKVPSIRGQRSVFLTEIMNHEDIEEDFLSEKDETALDSNEALLFNVIINTNVWYSDYRVTTNFPSNEQEFDIVKKSMQIEFNKQLSTFECTIHDVTSIENASD